MAASDTVRDAQVPACLTIGIDASRAFGRVETGTERYATAVIEHLVARGGHRYRLYCRTVPARRPPAQADVRVLRAPRLWTHTRLWWEVRRRAPDVLFVPAHVLPIAGGSPSVVTVHDLGYLVHPDAHPRAQRWYLDVTTRHHVRRADHLIVDSASTRDDLMAFYGAQSHRISVVHLGVEPELAPPGACETARVRACLGLDPVRPYVLHVGTNQPRKNLSRLVRAFAGLAADWPDIDLVLAGRQGWGRDDLEAQVDALGLAGRVRRLGYVERADLPALYGGARLAIVPSLYEGFGLAALEAMACGAPVAVSAVSSLPEVVGDAGLLFDPTDECAIATAIARLLGDDSLRRAMAACGIARAAHFTWRRCADQVRDVLERVAVGAL